MIKRHSLNMSPIKYPGGLRIIECQTCSYAVVTEVDEWGIIKAETKIKINSGDHNASHSYIYTPVEEIADADASEIADDIPEDAFFN